jgi:hypothetical protein
VKVAKCVEVGDEDNERLPQEKLRLLESFFRPIPGLAAPRRAVEKKTINKWSMQS